MPLEVLALVLLFAVVEGRVIDDDDGGPLVERVFLLKRRGTALVEGSSWASMVCSQRTAAG